MKTYRSIQTGVYVGRQADQQDGEDYEIVEIPIDKEGLIEFVNGLQSLPSDDVAPPAPRASPRPEPSEEDKAYARFRADVAEGRVDLDETILAAPLETVLRLSGLVHERIREFYLKAKRSTSTDSQKE